MHENDGCPGAIGSKLAQRGRNPDARQFFTDFLTFQQFLGFEILFLGYLTAGEPVGKNLKGVAVV